MRESFAYSGGIIQDSHYSNRCKEWDLNRWKIFQPLVNKVKKLVNAQATGLDLGAGEGFFAKCCQENGLKVIALEGSTSAVEYSKNVLGVNAKVHNLKDLIPFEDNSFDFIMYYNVYEHVSNDINENVFREASRVLKPKGIFWVITTCKYDFVESREPEHINNTTPTQLYRFGERFGFLGNILPSFNISLFTPNFYDKNLNSTPAQKKMRKFVKKWRKPIILILAPLWVPLWFINAKILHWVFLDFISGNSNVFFRKK